MTQKKRNEIVFGKMMRNKGYYVHKFGDVRYAFCPHCSKTFPLPKAEKKPDFLVAMTYRFVEAKGAGNSWAFAEDFRPNQREFMDANLKLSWIFVEIGEGNAPAGKRAFLVPWEPWLEIERILLGKGHKSILFEKTERSRCPSIDECMMIKTYEIYWEKGAWKIPENHSWNTTIDKPKTEIPF
jgi:hypothetical protein